MKRIALMAILAGGLGMAGCTVVQTDRPPPREPAPRVTPPKESGPVPGSTVGKPVASGRPANYKSGANQAVWVWRENNGLWRLRTTTAGTLHRFHGQVRGHDDAGKVASVDIGKTESKDKVKFNDGKIDFDFNTKGDQDGFDFTVSGNECADFDIFVDNRPDPEHIVVGAAEQRPKHAHFTACP